MFEEAKRKYLLEHGHARFCPKVALIDMDGVLFDSMPNHAKSWLKVLSDNGIVIEEKEAYMHEGRTGRGTIEILYRRFFHREPTDEEVQDLYYRKATLFDSLPEAKVMNGAKEALDAIRDFGMNRILVTGSGQKLLLGRIEKFFPGHFTTERMVTAFDVKQGKPFPEPYLKGLEKGNAQPFEAIVIENAPLGVQAAKAAGVFTVAVNTGPLDDQVLYDAGCDVLLHSMGELATSLPLIATPFSLKNDE